MLPNSGVYVECSLREPIINRLRMACNDELSVEIDRLKIIIDLKNNTINNAISLERLYLYYERLTNIFHQFNEMGQSLAYKINDDFVIYFLTVNKDEYMLASIERFVRLDSNKESFPKTLKYLEMVSIIET